jgi:hypothetical protein
MTSYGADGEGADGYLEQRLRMLQEPRDHRMAALVERNGATLLLVDDLVLLLQPSDHSICRSGYGIMERKKTGEMKQSCSRIVYIHRRAMQLF